MLTLLVMKCENEVKSANAEGKLIDIIIESKCA